MGEVSTFSGMALEMMRRPVWPVLGKQSVGQVGQMGGGRQSVGRQQVVLGGQVTMGGKAGEASEEDVRKGKAQKVPRETQIETVCWPPRVTPSPMSVLDHVRELHALVWSINSTHQLNPKP